ncbi:MAG: FAD-dependent oxidoreductase [Thermodesulfobacteriota bacterium]|nr:FAD-dependent oxidoreductase [Thermodesulfobacteriota bacterium]
MAPKIVIIGGGPAGFSAAMVAKRVGADVTLIERTDALGGLGLVAGIGIFGAAESIYYEEKVMGAGDLGDIYVDTATHRHVKIPGVGDDSTLYNVMRLDARMQRACKDAGVEFLLRKTVVDAAYSGGKIESVMLQDGTSVSGDVFIDASGATNGTTDCNELGRGCVGCIYRCPTFGAPGGIAEKRSKVVSRINAYGKPGVIGTSTLIPIVSLSKDLQKRLKKEGYAIIPVPPTAKLDEDRMKRAGAPYMFRHNLHTKNIIVLDVGGHIKTTAIGSPMWVNSLRCFPGFEDAWVAQPTAGKIGHLVTWTTMAYRDNCLRAEGWKNLFVAGHKAGPSICLFDAHVMGDLAGYNAARMAFGKECIELPLNTMAGAYIDYLGRVMRTEEGLKRGYSIIEIEILETLGVYRTDRKVISQEVKNAGLKGIYAKKLT